MGLTGVYRAWLHISLCWQIRQALRVDNKKTYSPKRNEKCACPEEMTRRCRTDGCGMLHADEDNMAGNGNEAPLSSKSMPHHHHTAWHRTITVCTANAKPHHHSPHHPNMQFEPNGIPTVNQAQQPSFMPTRKRAQTGQQNHS